MLFVQDHRTERWNRIHAGLMFIISFCLSTHFTLNPFFERPNAGTASNFFISQSKAVLHGTFAVAPSELPAECYVYFGKCLGYYGLTPSIARIPQAMLGLPSFTCVWIAIWSSLCAYLISKLLHVNNLWIEKISIVSLTSGGALIYLSRAAVYEEAIVASLAFGLAAMYFWLRSIQTYSLKLAVLVLVVLTLGSHSRPTVFGLCIGIGIGTLFLFQNWKFRIFGLLYIFIPLATVFSVNWMKFRMLIPNLSLNEQVPEATHWANIFASNGSRDMSLGFIFTTGWNYFRIDGLSVSSAFPFFDFRIPGRSSFRYIFLQPGSLYVERMTTVPVAFAGSLFVICKNTYQTLGNGSWRGVVHKNNFQFFWLIVGGALSVIPTMTNVAMTNRYLLDFLPFFVAILMLSISSLRKMEDSKTLKEHKLSLSAIVMAGAIINAILIYRWSWGK